jgi:hypothetical protein
VIPRPGRPSTGAVQARALLERVSRTESAPAGGCWEAIKSAILACGGYGDLLDIARDERFASQGAGYAYQAAATGLWHAIQDGGGPASFGLQELAPDPTAAPAGALLVTQHNGHSQCPVDATFGDVVVLGGVVGGDRWVCTQRAPLRDENLEPLPGDPPPALYAEALVVEREPTLRPGRPPCVRVESLEGASLGWVERSLLEPVAERLLAFNDGRSLLPADPRRWRSAPWAGSILAIYWPLDRI